MYDVFATLPVTTSAFIFTIVLATVFFHIRYDERDLHYGPMILTMLGIFGYFLGIATGLVYFDTNDIQHSVPNLLDGIKTSFWASIAGIGCALTIKTRYQISGPPRFKPEAAVQGATVDDLARLLQSLHQSLAGKEDSTLLSQVKLLRQDTGDGLKALNSSLEDYMQRMAENNSKALIEALKEVIWDFNAKINEQFGDNFKQLNSAVERILVWQEAYRQQMAEMIDQQRATTENMSIAAARYSELVQQAERFTTTAASLQTLLTALESQREHLHGALTHLGNLLKAAGDGLPHLEEKITELTRQIEASVQNTSETLAAASKELTRNVQDFSFRDAKNTYPERHGCAQGSQLSRAATQRADQRTSGRLRPSAQRGAYKIYQDTRRTSDSALPQICGGLQTSDREPPLAYPSDDVADVHELRYTASSAGADALDTLGRSDDRLDDGILVDRHLVHGESRSRFTAHSGNRDPVRADESRTLQ